MFRILILINGGAILLLFIVALIVGACVQSRSKETLSPEEIEELPFYLTRSLPFLHIKSVVSETLSSDAGGQLLAKQNTV